MQPCFGVYEDYAGAGNAPGRAVGARMRARLSQVPRGLICYEIQQFRDKRFPK
jgi:hypothetical protein